MSSHHVVKAKQEPALLIMSLKNFDLEYLGQLLEWSPTLLVTADVYEEVESLGIKIDVVLGRIEAAQSDVIQIDVVGDYHLAGLDYLLQEAYPAVNVVSDSVLPVEKQIYGAINLVWFCHNAKTYRVATGFSVWKPAGTTFKFDEKISTASNVNKVMENTFVVATDGFVTFSSSLGDLFIEESIRN